jgi:hypothetical protein
MNWGAALLPHTRPDPEMLSSARCFAKFGRPVRSYWMEATDHWYDAGQARRPNPSRHFPAHVGAWRKWPGSQSILTWNA